jgi:site-specific recombinase XerD
MSGDVQAAGDKFIAYTEAQKSAEATINKYRLLFKQLAAFSQRGLRYLAELDLQMLDDFRFGWKDGPRSSAKKLERLRAFFCFAQKRNWVLKNPASDLKAPKVTLCPTLPYTREEMMRILGAIAKYQDEFPTRGKENAMRIRALVLLLRYTGMRIGDAVSLASDSCWRVCQSKEFLCYSGTRVCGLLHATTRLGYTLAKSSLSKI